MGIDAQEVNITMLVRDRYRLTRQALYSLAQSGIWTMANVTILDDRSEELTQEFLMDWTLPKGNALYQRNSIPCGTGELRNQVVGMSADAFGRGTYVYLSDNDVWFQPDWLSTLIECYEDAWAMGFRVLGGYNHPFHLAQARAYAGDREVWQVGALASQSMLMRWEVWDEWGPFVSTPVDRVCQSEDVAFCRRITDAGWRVGVVSPAVVAGTGVTNTFGESIPGAALVRASVPAGVVCE